MYGNFGIEVFDCGFFFIIFSNVVVFEFWLIIYKGCGRIFVVLDYMI